MKELRYYEREHAEAAEVDLQSDAEASRQNWILVAARNERRAWTGPETRPICSNGETFRWGTQGHWVPLWADRAINLPLPPGIARSGTPASPDQGSSIWERYIPAIKWSLA